MSLRTRQFAVALLAVFTLGVGAVQAADAFYTNLLRDGTGARARGEFEAAIEDLRIACFGLLDEPPLLAQGLIELALAQASAGQLVEFERSVDRLLQVERQFQGYSQAELATGARQQFEDLLYRRVDPTRLEGIAAFTPLAERREMETLTAAAPDRRRLMLQERLAADPTDAQWLRMAADLETAQGQPAAAVPHLSALLDRTPDDAVLQCERFHAAAQAGLCDIALAELPACPADAAVSQVAEPILDCQIGRLDWRGAAAYLEALPANIRSTSKIRKLDRQVQKELRSLPAIAETNPPPTGSPIEGDADTTDTTEEPGGATGDLATNTAPIIEAEPAPNQPPPDPCAGFETAARAGHCPLALPDLETCQATVRDVKVARPLLRCLVDQQAWPEATGFLAALPVSVRSNSKIRKLERQVSAGVSEETTATETPTETADDLAASPEPEVDTAEQTANLAPPSSAPADASTPAAEPESLAPPPDPCDPFRTAARRGRCDAALAEMATCLGAAAERDIAPAIMKCRTDAGQWADALAFAEFLPPQVRGLSKIRRLERRATQQLAKLPSPPAEEGIAGATDESATALTPPASEAINSSSEVASTPALPDPSPHQPAPVAPSEAALADARRVLASASTSADITRAYAITSRLALDHPGHHESQILAAQGAYRAAQWDKAVAFFDAAGGPGADRPLLQFYNAIALFETGRPREAADLLDLALPKIRRTPFVDSYAARIRSAAGRR